MRTTAGYLMPALLVATLVELILLIRSGTSGIPWSLALPGLIYVGGGPVFDVAATILHDPYLITELNPFARVWLDNGHSVQFVYLLGGLCQILVVLATSAWWVALLRHRDSIVDSVRGHSSFLRFLKAATGGERLSLRQWLLPMRSKDFPDLYAICWPLGAGVCASSLYRWILGAEWCGFPHGYSTAVGVSAYIGGTALYIAWLWNATNTRAQSVSTPTETSGAF